MTVTFVLTFLSGWGLVSARANGGPSQDGGSPPGPDGGTRSAEIAAEVARFFDGELAKFERELEQQTQQMDVLRRADNPAAPDLNPAELKAARNRLTVITGSIARDRASLDALQDLSAQEPIPSPDDAARTQELVEARARLAELDDRLTPQHPDVLRQRRVVTDLQLAVTRALGASSANASRAAARAQEIRTLADRIASAEVERRRAAAAVNAIRGRANAPTTENAELESLTRNHAALQAVYAVMLAKADDAKRSAARLARTPPDVPRRATPARRALPWVAVVAFACALAAGVGLEARDTRTSDSGDHGDQDRR